MGGMFDGRVRFNVGSSGQQDWYLDNEPIRENDLPRYVRPHHGYLDNELPREDDLPRYVRSHHGYFDNELLGEDDLSRYVRPHHRYFDDAIGLSGASRRGGLPSGSACYRLEKPNRHMSPACP